MLFPMRHCNILIVLFNLSKGPNELVPYGYEYCGQEVLFTPLLVADRVAYSVLSVMGQGDICLLKQDVRKSLFRTLANIYGRQVKKY